MGKKLKMMNPYYLFVLNRLDEIDLGPSLHQTLKITRNLSNLIAKWCRSGQSGTESDSPREGIYCGMGLYAEKYGYFHMRRIIWIRKLKFLTYHQPP